MKKISLIVFFILSYTLNISAQIHCWPITDNKPYFVLKDTICTGRCLKFEGRAPYVPTFWRWRFGGGVPAISNEQNVTVCFPDKGLYGVQLIAGYGSNDSSGAGTTYWVHDCVPVAAFDASKKTICKGECISLTDKSRFQPRYWLWEINGQTYSAIKNPNVCFSKEGNYAIKLTVGNEAGIDTMTQYISVLDAPEGRSIDSTLYINKGDTVHLKACSIANTYDWQPPNQVSCNNCNYITAIPKQETNFIATLSNGTNCTLNCTYRVKFKIKQNTVYIPNIFTPNKDGVNDYFTLFTNKDIKIKQLSIFSRWGELVFQKQDIPANAEIYGWDGTDKNKVLLNNGVYIYIFEIEDENGETQMLNGDITILK